MQRSMYCDRAMDENESSEDEVDWMDTNWDKVEVETKNRSINFDGDTETKVGSSGVKTEGKSSLMSRMQLNDYKAGMQGLDKEHINQVIYELSKGSRFFENERRKEEQVQQRIQTQEQRRRDISEAELQRGENEADILIAQLSSSRDMSQTIVHVDMDAFYAAVEMRDNPSLRNKPMAVGSIGMLGCLVAHRYLLMSSAVFSEMQLLVTPQSKAESMLSPLWSTSNYEARKYGVRAAMPGFIGRKLCPQLVIVPLSFPRYREISHQVQQIFSQYDENFCPMSLDEAYLNFTDHLIMRQRASQAERSVIKRCQTPADPALCRCDLNCTIRNTVLKEEGVTGLPDASCPKQECHFLEHSSENLSASCVRAGDCSFEQNLPSSVEVHSSCHEADAQSFVDSYTQSQINADLSVTPSTSTVQSLDGQNRMSVEAGSPCPICDKPIPQYEVAVFGLDIESAVHEMRCRIEQRTCLTASTGIAPNMMLSKVCSDQNKPNGQFFLSSAYEDGVLQFVRNLSIRKISGIGRVTEQLLGALGITTCRDLFEQRALLYHLYSPVSFNYFMRVACGVGSTHVASAREEERKSMSTEQTFGELSQPDELYAKCLELCQSLAEDLAKEELVGKTVSLKLKTTDFQVRTRAQTMNTYTRDVEVFFAAAKAILRCEILAESPKLLCLRLMGVRMSKLVAEGSCPQERQDTILGFLKKTSASISKASLICEQQKKDASASTGQDFTPLDVIYEPLDTDFVSPYIDQQQDCQEQVTGTELTEKSGGVADLHSNVHVFGKTSPQKLTKSRPETVSLVFKTNCSATSCSEDNNYVVQDKAVVSNGQNRRSVSIAGNNLGMKPLKETDCEGSEENVIASCEQNKDVISCRIHEINRENTKAIVTAAAIDQACVPPSCSSSASSPDSRSLSVDYGSSSTDAQQTMDRSWFVKEPSFTCPVCCKPIGCINLTDFNAHIDKCLLTSSGNPNTLDNGHSSGTQQSAKSNSCKSVLKPAHSGLTSSPLNSSHKKPKHSMLPEKAHSSRSPSAVVKNSKTAFGSGVRPYDVNDKKVYSSTSSMCPKSNSDTCSVAETQVISRRLDASLPRLPTSSISVKVSGGASHSWQTEQESVDYMVCPLCSAERADWTLETFNQHVDACLNRDAIAKILQEQSANEELPRKRPASSPQEENRSSQQGKKAKKTKPSHPERSILSFFKT